MSSASLTTVHHLYRRAGDLLPACGITPGPDSDPTQLDWHTGHIAPELLAIATEGFACCMLCLQLM